MKPAAWIAALSFVLPLMASAAAPDEKSLEALRSKAKGGNVTAQLDMGILYEYGFNFPDNKAPALAWYTLAAEQGSELAAKRRDVIKGKMTPTEIAEANKLRESLSAKAPMTEPVAPPPAKPAEVEPVPVAPEAAPTETPPAAAPETPK